MVDFKEEKYDGSKPIPLTKHVFTHPLANCPGKSQVGLLLTFPPGASFPPHTHNGAAVTAYVIKGSVYNAMNSAPVELKHGGDNWHEAPGCHHRLSMNASENEEAEFLSTLIIDTEVVEKEGVMGLTVVDEEFQDTFMQKMKESGQA